MKHLKGGQYLIDLTSIGSLENLSETKSVDISSMFNNVFKELNSLADLIYIFNTLCSKKWYAKVITGVEQPMESIVDINFTASDEEIVGRITLVDGLICDIYISPRSPISMYITKRE